VRNQQLRRTRGTIFDGNHDLRMTTVILRYAFARAQLIFSDRTKQHLSHLSLNQRVEAEFDVPLITGCVIVAKSRRTSLSRARPGPKFFAAFLIRCDLRQCFEHIRAGLSTLSGGWIVGRSAIFCAPIWAPFFPSAPDTQSLALERWACVGQSRHACQLGLVWARLGRASPLL
jgi:hypothetical protein